LNPFIPAATQRNLVLASESARRREILERLGFEFEVLPTGIEENGLEAADPVEFAKLLAGRKAAAASRLRPGSTIVAADTIVVCGGEFLGKPTDASDARRMLELLSGRRHDVVTGVALVAPGAATLVEAEATKVYVRGLSGGEIARYIETGEPFGKAGAYAIQGYAAPFIRKIEGCYFNVVGLPVSLLFDMFARIERGNLEIP
jgi:septum formation protein